MMMRRFIATLLVLIICVAPVACADAATALARTGSKTATPVVMGVSAYGYSIDYNHVGHEWIEEFFINGAPVTRNTEIELVAGDQVTLEAKITEDDQYPDIGSTSVVYDVTADDIRDGFEVSFNVDVVENMGRYSGSVAVWTVTFTFK